jgi:hypothetical protein
MFVMGIETIGGNKKQSSNEKVNRAMAFYKYRDAETTLELKERIGTSGAVIFELFPLGGIQAELPVAGIGFQMSRDGQELIIKGIQVGNDANRSRATTQNDYPGVGQLMMYLACQSAKRLGARMVRLDSVDAASGFYRRFGMRHPANPGSGGLPALSHVLFASTQSPTFSVPRLTPLAINGRLDSARLNIFNSHIEYTRKGGEMIAEIDTMLFYIGMKVENQWVIRE